MTGTESVDRRRGSYFFLSYAHPSPLAGSHQSNPDESVKRFFADLQHEVSQRAAPGTELNLGSFDQEIRPGANWKSSLSEALETAEMFVALYSPAYFDRSWPGREWECFHRRMTMAGVEDPLTRIAPVLWTPLRKNETRPEVDAALAFGGDDPEYAENGLRALWLVKPYRDVYRAVVGRLAERVVRLAEDAPVGPSPAPDIDQTESPFAHMDTSLGFMVTVAAPTFGTLPAWRDSGRYGETGGQWRPYHREQDLPLAAYAQDVAERLDISARISDLGTHAARIGDLPGVVLIDPWFLATDAGPGLLRSAFAGLPSWVLPLIVIDTPGDARAEELAQGVRDILVAAEATPTEAARRAAEGVTSLQNFIEIMPVLIAEAERQYLRYGPVGAVAGPASPRGWLRGARPDAPAPDSLRPGEQPDA